jgi:hypothetical protein
MTNRRVTHRTLRADFWNSGFWEGDVINEDLARRYWLNGDAIGNHFRLSGATITGQNVSVHNRSDCEDYPTERAALNQVTQSISRFGQREGLSHDRFDRAGFK